MWWLLLILVVVEGYVHIASAAKILAICVVPSPSHSLWCYKYMAALAERGHQITVLGVNEPKFKIPNMTTFIGHEVQDAFKVDVSETGWMDQGVSKIKMLYPDFKVYNEIATKAILHSKALKDLLKLYENEKKPFDLIFHDNPVGEALLGLVPRFGNPPLILGTPWGSPQWMMFRIGNVLNPAYVPNMILDAEPNMDFFQRCKNTFFYVFVEWFYNFVTFPSQDKMMRERFGDHLPSVKDIAKRANIILITYHFVLDSPRPLLPGVIGVAGLHFSEPKPLPQDIKQYMDGAKDGVIVMSFGTNVDSSWLPKDFEASVVEAFKQLPQRVLWKWDRDVPNLPANVRVHKWLPQSDMMAHPKMRLFITHCGLASTHEAIFNKLPVLALPIFFDQVQIAEALVRRNLTIQLNVFDLTTLSLCDSVKEVLSNPMYKSNMEKIGELMRDNPLTARQLAVYWTEYALRHDGAPHLRSAAADMPWHQFLLLDVLAAMILAVLVFVWAIRTIITFLLRLCMRSKSKNKTE